MNQDEFDQLVKQLSLLTKAQMQDLRRRLAFLIGGGSVGQQSDWLLDGIFTVLRERGQGHMIPSAFRIQKSDSYGGYETQADRVRQVLMQAIPDMKLTETKSIGVIAARSLADFIPTIPAKEGSPPHAVNLHNMLKYVGRIPDALDAAFPGYLESGLLGFLIRR